MKYLSPIYSDARGSVAGTTYSKNKGGLYTRNRAKPTNPNTPQQQAIREAITQASSRWGSNLSTGQRAAWEGFAQTNPIINKLGVSTTVSGINMFMKVNIPMQLVAPGTGWVDDAPGNVPFLSALTVTSGPTWNSGSDSWTFELTFPSDIEDGDQVWVYVTAPRGPGRTPNNLPARLMTYRSLTAAMTPTPIEVFTAVTDPFTPINRVTDSQAIIRAYWSRGGNISTQVFAQVTV